MSSLEATHAYRATGFRQPIRITAAVAVLAAALSVLLLLQLLLSAPAYAGKASTGELAFYPCTQCHPVTLGADGKPTKPLPNGFQKHEITLEVHDILGEGDKACLACHQSPDKNPGLLIAANGSLVDVSGDTSQVCQRCHFEKYQQWKQGVHGKRAPQCTSAGCHDPHSPSWIYVAGLEPFQGTGMEVRAVSATRLPFKAFPGPPPQPPVYTPAWLTIFASLGFVVVLGLTGLLVFGKANR